MPHTREKLLADALGAADAVDSFLTGRNRAEYDTDLMLRSAIERQFEILGEALRRLELIDPVMVNGVDDYRRIISFRNVIAHGYDSIDSDIVWQVIREKLPVLADQVRGLLVAQGPAP